MVLGEMIKHVNYRMNEEPEGGHGMVAGFIVIMGMICCYAIYLIFKGIYNIIKLIWDICSEKKDKNKEKPCNGYKAKSGRVYR